MVSIVGALNKAYDIEEARPWWKVRLVSIGLDSRRIPVRAGGVSRWCSSGPRWLTGWATRRLGPRLRMDVAGPAMAARLCPGRNRDRPGLLLRS
jgi:hypothetical protein